MADGQGVWVRAVKPNPTRTQLYEAFAAALRAEPGVYLDAADVTGEFPTANAAKSFAYRVNHGHAVAFRGGRYHAVSEDRQVSIAYVAPQPAQEAS